MYSLTNSLCCSTPSSSARPDSQSSSLSGRRWTKNRRLTCVSRQLSLIMIMASCVTLVSACSSRSQALGDITADSNVKEGDRFAIKCSLTQSAVTDHHFNSSSIMFHFHDQVVDQTKIRIVDEKSAEIVLEPAKVADSGFYYCYVKSEVAADPALLVCSMQLEVGSPPSQIGPENLSCISQDYENLTCTWKTLNFNTKTNWTLLGYLGSGQTHSCPIILSENSCRWTTHTHPMYRKHVRRLKFVLRIQNNYGTVDEMFTINHFEIIRPAQPADVSISDVTSTSIELLWKLQQGFDFGSGGREDDLVPVLLYQVQVIPELRSQDAFNITTKNLGMNITSLIPNTTYKFKIRCKTTDAKADHMWSDAVIIHSRTKPAAPSRSPLFWQTFESIRINDRERNIVVYWEPVDERDANGDGFYYVITAAPTIGSRNRFRRTAAPESIGEMSFRIKSIKQSSLTIPSLSPTTAYLFRIYSANLIGQSSASSSLRVDKEAHLSEKPATVEAYYYDNNRYEVRWAYPSSVPDVDSTSVSWCPVNHTKSSAVNRCSQPLRVAVITRPMQKAHTITVSEDSIYQFGVSANYKDNTSSPVVWASCVVPISIKKLDKIHKFSVRAVNATAVRVSWKLPCDGLQAVVAKFEVLYCRISFSNNSCSDYVSHEVMGGASEFLTIASLEPLTAYRFVMRAWTESTAGVNSDPVDETTPGTDVSFWNTFFSLFLLLCLVVGAFAAIFAIIRWYRRMMKNMKAPIVLPGRLAGEKINFSDDHSYEASDKRRTRDSAGNLFNASYGFFDHQGSSPTSSSYDDLVHSDVNQIPEVLTSYDVMNATGTSNDLIRDCDRNDSIGLSSFGRFSSEPRNRSRSAGRRTNPEIDELCPGNSSDTTAGSQDSGLEFNNMSAKSRRRRMMRKDSPATGSSTETSAGTCISDRGKRRSHQQETSFNVEEDGPSERPGSSKNDSENKSINLCNGRTGIPVVNGYVTHDVICKLQEERKRLPAPDSPIIATSVSLEEDDSAFISDSTTRSSSTDSSDSATDPIPPVSASHSPPFVKNNSGYVSVPVPHLAPPAAYLT